MTSNCSAVRSGSPVHLGGRGDDGRSPNGSRSGQEDDRPVGEINFGSVGVAAPKAPKAILCLDVYGTVSIERPGPAADRPAVGIPGRGCRIALDEYKVRVIGCDANRKETLAPTGTRQTVNRALFWAVYSASVTADTVQPGPKRALRAELNLPVVQMCISSSFFKVKSVLEKILASPIVLHSVGILSIAILPFLFFDYPSVDDAFFFRFLLFKFFSATMLEVFVWFALYRAAFFASILPSNKEPLSISLGAKIDSSLEGAFCYDTLDDLVRFRLGRD